MKTAIPKRIRDRYQTPKIIGPWTDTALLVHRTMKTKGLTSVEVRQMLQMDMPAFSALMQGLRIPMTIGHYAHWDDFVDLPLLFEAIGRDFARQADDRVLGTSSGVRLTIQVDGAVADLPFRIDYAVRDPDGVMRRGIWPTRFNTWRDAYTAQADIRIALAKDWGVN